MSDDCTKIFRRATFEGAALNVERNTSRKGLMNEADAIAAEQGTVEEIIARCADSLNLSFCKLSMFPSPIMHLHVITSLNLEANDLHELPDDFGSLCFLTFLSLKKNRLRELPATMCMMDQLQTLDISNNLLSSLPDELSDLNALEKFATDYNYLSCIPKCCFDGMRALRQLLIVENPAIVSVPEDPNVWLRHTTNPTKRVYIEIDNSPEMVSSMERLFSGIVASGLTCNIDVKWNKVWPDQVVDKVFLGSLRTVQNTAAVSQMNVTHVLTCGRNLRTPLFPPTISQMVLEVDDSEEEDMNQHFVRAIDFIDDCVAKQGTCIVHCFAGVSRSATVVVAFLMKRRQMSFNQALMFVQDQRPAANPNPNFRRQLMNFEAYLRSLQS